MIIIVAAHKRVMLAKWSMQAVWGEEKASEGEGRTEVGRWSRLNQKQQDARCRDSVLRLMKRTSIKGE
jgi:hypothetical protein